MYNLKLDKFKGHEGYKGAERWLEHIEKTFLVFKVKGIYLLKGGHRRLHGSYVKNRRPGGDRRFVI